MQKDAIFQNRSFLKSVDGAKQPYNFLAVIVLLAVNVLRNFLYENYLHQKFI